MSDSPAARPVSFEEAQEIILQYAFPGEQVVELPLAEAAGQILGETVPSPIEMPRFHRAAMDGYACAHGEESDRRRVVVEVAAGDARGVRIGAGECARIMTGAPVPEGADTVVPFEESGLLEDAGRSGEEWVRFTGRLKPGANIAPRGEDLRVGEEVARAGDLLRPHTVAALASVGRTRVLVTAGPSIAFAATGEELVEPGGALTPGAIYNANASTLEAQIRLAQARPTYLGVAPDTLPGLRELVERGLQHDMLILSGGVSAGRYDHVPEVLAGLGVTLHFHKVLVQPGRPTVFGTRGRTLVFGLPGNPVSTLYAFDQYVAPAVRLFRRHPQPAPTRYWGVLGETVRKKTGRMLLQPCVCQWSREGCLLQPIRTHGSGDVFALHGADALALIPAGVEAVEQGKPVAFRRLYEY